MRILITGGTGSFGTAFARSLLQGKAATRIVVYSRGEHRQAQMREEMDDPGERLRFLIGDVRDRDRLKRAMQGIEVVIHAAALKRIEVGHYNPVEMIKTNVDGAINVIEAAQDAEVKKVVAISSDKAFQPVSPYGISKALAEALFLAANNTTGWHGPRFSVCRYGNVWRSAGSVVPRWEAMLRTQDTVPVTDPDCTRFYMTMDQAVRLVMNTAIDFRKGGDLIVPTLPAYRLGDLADAMGAKINVLGLPAWEKKHESMETGNSSDEARRMTKEEIQGALAATPVL